MEIIIVGCGKVGRTLALQLQQEDTDLTIIDENPQKLALIANQVDSLNIEGNGASIRTLKEAGIETADLLIAVTGSDELNLLCCLIAQQSPKCHTIARVRNPVYFRESSFIKERLGLTMIINPEYDAAKEIVRLFSIPTALKMDSFSGGQVELLKIKILPEYRMDGMLVGSIQERFHLDILICGIENKEGVTIPGGNKSIHDGDTVWFLASQETTRRFFQKIGLKSAEIKSTMIVGGGMTAYYVASRLIERGKVSVKIIEKDKARSDELCELLPEATIIQGDGTNRELLMEEGLQSAGSFLTMTNLDEENIFLSLYAKSVSKAKTIAKVNRLEFNDIIENLEIGSVIYPKDLTADHILQYVRAMENSIGSNVETLFHIMDGKAEALEFLIRDNSRALGIPLSELKLKSNLLVGCIHREGKVIIPRGHDEIRMGDRVIIVTSHPGLRDISDILE